MGRLFLIEYDQTPDNVFFLCRLCQTQVALADELLSNNIVYIFFQRVVNVVIDDPVHYRTDANHITEADVLCTKCNRLLGRKYVDAKEPTLELRDGPIRMEMNKLLLWNGERLLTVDALTMIQEFDALD